MPSWQTANVLERAPGGRRLWQLNVEGGQFIVTGDTLLLPTEPAPEEAVSKDWHNLYRPKLNIAWLPLDKAFLRVVQLPTSDPAEMAAMIELQLEKLSPLPVTHVVWSIYPLAKPADQPDALQTVLVIIAQRSFVEEYLRELESVGYLADRLESPGLDELLATDIHEYGVWIFPGDPGQPAVVGWWRAGVLQYLTLAPLPAGPERAEMLKSQIEQIAWVGEVEGWLIAPPVVHLVAKPAEAAFWEPILREWSEQPIDVRAPIAPEKLAAFGARRCATPGPNTSLVPPDFASRYQQQYYDGLWMRGLFAVVAVYLVGVLCYFCGLKVESVHLGREQQTMNGLKAAYTNALSDFAQIQILKERQNLQYAALDAWKAIAQSIPDTVTVDDFYFSRDSVELRGTVTAGDEDGVTTFNEALRHVTKRNEDQPLFADVGPPTLSTTGNTSSWHFSCKLQQTEAGE